VIGLAMILSGVLLVAVAIVKFYRLCNRPPVLDRGDDGHVHDWFVVRSEAVPSADWRALNAARETLAFGMECDHRTPRLADSICTVCHEVKPELSDYIAKRTKFHKQEHEKQKSMAEAFDSKYQEREIAK
jgi:hypothetical protein